MKNIITKIAASALSLALMGSLAAFTTDTGVNIENDIRTPLVDIDCARDHNCDNYGELVYGQWNYSTWVKGTWSISRYRYRFNAVYCRHCGACIHISTDAQCQSASPSGKNKADWYDVEPYVGITRVTQNPA